ncbi:MAG: hypothetical protein JJW00_04295 [Sulfurimonas sp.]|nr:hypothetical protein [Sulfurimonas sp.]
MMMSFKCSIHKLQVEHRALKDFGKFSIFCIKAVSNGVNLDDISSVVQIEKQIIKRELAFAISRKYVSSDFMLTQKGAEMIRLFDFVNLFNKKDREIAINHCTNSAKIPAYLSEHLVLESEKVGHLIKDSISKEMATNRFKDINKENKDEIKNSMLCGFDEYSHTIKSYLKDFKFTLLDMNIERYYSHSINEEESLELKEKACIGVKIDKLGIDGLVSVRKNEFIFENKKQTKENR